MTTKTKLPPANTAAALARYPSLTIGGAVDVESHHTEPPLGRAVLVAVYETGSAVLVETRGHQTAPRAAQHYVWDTQVTAAR